MALVEQRRAQDLRFVFDGECAGSIRFDAELLQTGGQGPFDVSVRACWWRHSVKHRRR